MTNEEIMISEGMNIIRYIRIYIKLTFSGYNLSDNCINSIAFFPKSNKFVAAGGQGEIFLCNSENSKHTQISPCNRNAIRPKQLLTNPSDGITFASVDQDAAQIWDSRSENQPKLSLSSAVNKEKVFPLSATYLNSYSIAVGGAYGYVFDI